MKTRTLLLLSVAVAMAILLAGGVFLLQLSNETATVDVADIGTDVEVGDVHVTVVDVAESGGTLSIDVRLGGVDDADGIDSFRLITGSDPLAPVMAPDAGRCAGITVEPADCRVDFEVDASEGSNRVLVLRRGDEQRRWDLTDHLAATVGHDE